MKVENSFKKLAEKMENLKENEMGKLKGGISVVATGTNPTLGNNTGTCINHGTCNDVNDGLCFNNKSNCPITVG
ncbi:hypothetical protein EG240_10520 [Paenimyroides tangerinum]|uniref:Uncharacterized protein n=1 Tax=Paenimyroides tangerinum TaxID=2488728 RepID=A0A3P3W3Z7_9FLAO|nr:hypothetical protein [Paenimyroides tangerinum]RRJ89822.1 hypothetical protein EG240_10520 [Paenimyroides tangerinum]